jgi:3-oxoadipate enol-lactonase
MPTVPIHPPAAPALDVYYEESGSGVPVVLVGGLTSSLEAYEPQAEGLSQQYWVITPDNRGSGRTRIVDDDGDRGIARMATDLLCFLDALELDRVHLLGTSMGGMIVQQFATEHCDRLLSLVIGCSQGGSSVAIPPTDETIGILIAGNQDDASEEAKRANQEMMFHPNSLTGDRSAFDFYNGTKEFRPHSGEEVGRRMQAIMEFDVWDRLPELDVPTLVITGTGDNLIPHENSVRLAERIPGARLELLEDAGHIFWVEQSQTTNRLLCEHFGCTS